MTFIWLGILLLSGRQLLKVSKAHKVDLQSQRIITTKPTTNQEREHDFHSLMAKIRDNQKNEGVKERTEEDMDPTELVYAREVEESLKPGYQNDPEWQALSDRAKETVKRNGEAEEANLARME